MKFKALLLLAAALLAPAACAAEASLPSGMYAASSALAQVETYTVMDTLYDKPAITKPGTYYLTGNGVTVGSKGITVDAGGPVTIVLDHVLIRAEVAFVINSGEVTLLLKGDNYLHSTGTYAGLQNGEHPLTISSVTGDGNTDATLTAIGSGGAGIGGGYNGDDFINGSNITIRGGIVTAIGGSMSAGIGGSFFGNGENISVTGGAVYAMGGDGAAGIGGGAYGSGGTISIFDGTVVAKGGKKAAGIGGGMSRGEGRGITITGGDVTAIGGEYGAGIGGGNEGRGSEITLSGGTVRAMGGLYAAGAGGGSQGDGENVLVTATDKSITVCGGQGSPADIGGGLDGETINCGDGTEPPSPMAQAFSGSPWSYVVVAAAALLAGGWSMVLLLRSDKKAKPEQSSRN